MINEIILNIKQDKKLYEYLKYHSYWYDLLTFNPKLIKEMIKEMKIELKETFGDKLYDLNKKMEYINLLIDVIK